MRVLISGDEGTGTLAAVRSLHAAGHEVWLAVSRADTYAARSRAVTGVVNVNDPNEDVERHAADLADTARRIEAEVVLPGTEGSLRALTGREHRFEQGTVVGTSGSRALDRATDKLVLQTLAQQAGLEPAPTADLLASDLDLDALSFPALVKPRRSVEETTAGQLVSSEVSHVDDANALRALLVAEGERHRLLQRRLDGMLTAVCGVAWRGELVCAVHQVSPRIWPPGRGTSAYAMTVEANAKRELGVAKLVRQIGWSGVFGVQFLTSEDHAYLIDFNPRIYGSLALAIAAGANLPALWVALLLGRPTVSAPPRPGVHYRVEEDDPRALLELFRGGRRRQALLGLLPRPRTVHAVFALDDPAPALVSAQKLSFTRHEVRGPTEEAARLGKDERFRLARDTCALLDRTVNDRVLVFGSLPPHGQDLDLLVRPAEQRACHDALTAADFAVHGHRLARFDRSSAYGVELQPVAELGLSTAEEVALFADATPLEGLCNLCEPAPHHRLLLLACFVLDDPSRPDVKRRRRIACALAQDRSAWEHAARHAAGWPRGEALARLRHAYENSSTRSRSRRVARGGMVIALSGIDGAGKSAQAESLRAALTQLGYDAAIEWVPMASNRSLNWIGRPLKWALLRLGVRPEPQGAPTGPGEPRGRVHNTGSALRQRSATATHIWVTLVSLVNGIAHLRAALPHLVAGRIVIFDRYVLDSTVRMRFFYGEQHRFVLQRLLIRVLSPRPTCSFFLDVPASVSLERKDDRWHADELSAQVALYRAEYAAHGARRMDGELPRDQLYAQIAEAVWRHLS